MKEITARCKFCGGFGRRAKDYTAYSGQHASHTLHCVECSTCRRHTEHSRDWDKAIMNWNEQKFSEETMLLSRRVHAEDLNTKACISAVERILQDAYAEYSRVLERLCNDVSEAERKALLAEKDACERWYRATPFLGDKTGDEVIKGIQHRIWQGSAK